MINEEQKQLKQSRFNKKAWSIANVMGRLFRKHKYNTIDVEFPAGWSNCAVTVNNYFIADTNDSSNWDTIKFPLPKPKYKWQIRCYGDTLDRKNNKIFAVLIDM